MPITADLSALGGHSTIQMKKLKSIIAPSVLRLAPQAGAINYLPIGFT